jgi:DNA repair exonuclease SbcCD ATPase subunit
MEQLHRNMDEVVDAKHELARREAEIGELRNEVSRTMSAFRDERSAKERYMQLAENERLRANKAEMDCKELAYKMEAMQADLENTEKLYRETVKKLRVANGRMGAYKQKANKKQTKTTQDPLPTSPSMGRS